MRLLDIIDTKVHHIGIVPIPVPFWYSVAMCGTKVGSTINIQSLLNKASICYRIVWYTLPCIVQFLSLAEICPQGLSLSSPSSLLEI